MEVTPRSKGRVLRLENGIGSSHESRALMEVDSAECDEDESRKIPYVTHDSERDPEWQPVREALRGMCISPPKGGEEM